MNAANSSLKIKEHVVKQATTEFVLKLGKTNVTGECQSLSKADRSFLEKSAKHIQHIHKMIDKKVDVRKQFLYIGALGMKVEYKIKSELWKDPYPAFEVHGFTVEIRYDLFGDKKKRTPIFDVELQTYDRVSLESIMPYAEIDTTIQKCDIVAHEHGLAFYTRSIDSVIKLINGVIAINTKQADHGEE